MTRQISIFGFHRDSDTEYHYRLTNVIKSLAFQRRFLVRRLDGVTPLRVAVVVGSIQSGRRHRGTGVPPDMHLYPVGLTCHQASALTAKAPPLLTAPSADRPD